MTLLTWVLSEYRQATEAIILTAFHFVLRLVPRECILQPTQILCHLRDYYHFSTFVFLLAGELWPYHCDENRFDLSTDVEQKQLQLVLLEFFVLTAVERFNFLAVK